MRAIGVAVGTVAALSVCMAVFVRQLLEPLDLPPMAANWGVRSACPIVSSGPPATLPTGAASGGGVRGSRTSRAAGMITSQARLPMASIAMRQS